MVLPAPKYYEPSFDDDTPELPDTAAGPRQVSIAYYEAEDWEAYKQRPNARLCTSCEGYFPQDWKTLFTGHGAYELHPTYDMLKLSANAGCSFCEMICVAVSAGPSIYNPQQEVKLSTWLKETTASRFDRDTIAPNSELTIYVSVENGLQRVLDFKALLSAVDCDKHYSSLSEDSRIMRLEKTVMHEGLTKLPLPRIAIRGASTRHRHSMERARKWYETCVNTHPECCNVSERRLPTRLLSIKNGQVRLILGEDLDISTKYATLSHRWGNAELLQLTRENYQNFCQGIELDDLCKSFRDALDITLEFELMYLWIDSLCIVQNDEDDWKRESVLMSTVYGCSEITIAATSAHDGTEGCFYERQMPYPRFARVSVDVPDGHGIYDISPVFHEEWKFGDILSFRHGGSPLYRRAWAYQERILSYRVIHYTQYQLLWQCSTSRVEERGFDAITTGNDHPFVGRELFHRRDFWEDMVQEYSACNLTFMTDKLIAISGIATRWQEMFPDEYAAGMWRTGLEVALCWTVDIFRSPPVPARPEIYLAPSWSWASTQVDLDFREARPNERASAKLLSEVIDINITSVDNDPMGRIITGSMKVKIKCLLSASWVATRLRMQRQFLMAGGHALSVRTLFDDSTTKVPSYLLPMFEAGLRNPNQSEAPESEILPIGIVIQPCHQSPGHYKRIGQFRLFHVNNYASKGKCKCLTSPSQTEFTMPPSTWDNIPFTPQERELLFISSESSTGPHIIELI